MGNFNAVNYMWLWVENYWYVAMPICIISGLFLFFTQHEINNTINTITFSMITMGTIVSLVFFLFYIILLKDNTSLWVGWVILAVGVIISLPFCYMSSKYLGFGCIVCALPAGCSLAMILQVAVIYLVNL